MSPRVTPATTEVDRPEIPLSRERPIAAGVSRYPAPTSPAFDMHYGLEMGVVLAGRMRRHFPGLRRDLVPGDAWLHGMWEAHGFEARKAPCEALVVVMMPQAVAGTFFEEKPGLDWMAPFGASPGARPRVGRARRGEMLDLARRLAAAAGGRGELVGVRIRLLATEMLLLLLDGWRGRTGRDAPRPDCYRRIGAAVELVLSARRLVTVAEAARECRMSRNGFAASFSRLMGSTFAEFALRHRLGGAATDLVRTDAPLKAVAADWGFADASHLSRCFARRFGRTPGDYRRGAGRLHGGAP